MQTLVLGALLLACCLVAVGARDTNRIRSPAEGSRQQSLHRGRPTQTPLNSNRQSTACTGPQCDQPEQRDRCSNRAQRRGALDRQTGRQTGRQTDRPAADFYHGNRTEDAAAASCVRSADCGAGRCCVRYLNGRRCQRAPQDGEMCLLRGRSKRRRNPERCDCAADLACAPPETAPSTAPRTARDQGVCRPRQRQTRHSGKRRRSGEC